MRTSDHFDDSPAFRRGRVKIETPVRVRMAPSPTGHLHIGGGRTALFNYLFARHYGGSFILRIEDTDKERSRKEYEASILEGLRWLGLEWDEGPEIGGSYGPYHQSQRTDIYEKHKKALLEKGKVYHCFCSPEELELERKELLDNRQTPRYMGKCRELTKEQISRFESEGRKPVLRYRIDETDLIRIDDLIRGAIQVDPQILGDFIISKADGGPVYNFAAVVDDAEMRITHVIRGEEHISNTPRQILLTSALGFKPPQYAHVSVILAPDRTKLSKRHGATSLSEYQHQGYLPEALFNFLALLGWNPGDEREMMSQDEIIKSFSVERIIKSPAIFDVRKLSWMNGMYLRNRPLSEVVEKVIPYLERAGYPLKDKDAAWMEKMVDAVRGYLERFDQILEHADIFFQEKYILSDEALQKLKKNEQEAVQALKALDEILSKYIKIDDIVFKDVQAELKSRVSVKSAILFQTQRLVLTGRLSGPEMVVVMPLLGVKMCRQRIQQALALLP